ncbi:D-alanyl-D-alanine carboxypeptidase family protein [Virgibacillus sp. L01]|uniref:D-alanyl-D-alanine carboxypeptidase family protein n=1 Tax=Virgibacillus sp. L01 TaxID=3457429 RepID=UPI003FD42D1F
MKHKLTKGLSFLLIAIVMVTTIIGQPLSAKAAGPDVQAESAILVDAETGKILFSKNPDIALPPASMTKMMTEYLVWEAIENGKISWNTTTQISDYAYSISANNSFSGVGLTQSKDYTVQQLYDAMAINSDNATSIALAELIAGSEGEFVKMMNAKAKEMGLPDYKFVNSTGLANSDLGENYPKGTEQDASNRLSARSTALLAYNLVNDYPKALTISSVPSAEFDGQTIRNWNWMLPHDPETASSLQQFYYKGIDGLKTGHTDLAGYCFAGTAERNDQRYISVVMKTESVEARFQQTARLMDYGFNNFDQKELFAKGYQLENKSTLPIAKGKEDNVQIATNNSFVVPVKGEQAKNYNLEYHLDKDKLNKDGELTAPIKKGEKVGTAELVFNGETDYGYISAGDSKTTVDLVAQDTVEKDNWFMLTLGAIADFFTGLFSTVVDTVKGWF